MKLMCRSPTTTTHRWLAENLQRFGWWRPTFILLGFFLGLGFLNFHGITIATNGVSQGKIPKIEDNLVLELSRANIDQWSVVSPADASLPQNVYQERSKASLSFNSTVQFIFTMGLEGTGHHLIGSIARRSPFVDHIQTAYVWLNQVAKLQKGLYWHHYRGGADVDVGIWNAHCPDHRKDASRLEDELVENLRNVEEQVKTSMSANNFTANTKFPIPLNTVDANAKGSRVGEISYPNYLGPCRPLAYPDLSILYRACDKARVDCFHVYIHRNPFEILRSVVRRGFSTNDTSSMQLYTTHLYVLANQLRMHPERTLGCFALFGMDSDVWMKGQKDLWDFEHDQFLKLMKNLYKPPSKKNQTHAEQISQWIDETEDGPYLMAWWRAHSLAIENCRRAVKGSQL